MANKIIERNEELTLASEKIANAETILKASEKKVRFNFKINYKANEKKLLLSEIKRIGGVIKKELEKNVILTSLSMEQLAGVKTLTCIESVEVYNTWSHTADEQSNKKTLHINDNNDIITNKKSNISTLSLNSENDGIMLLSNNNCDEDSCSNNMDSAYDIPIGYWRKADICCPLCEVWFKFTVDEGTAYYNIFSDSEDSFDCMCTLYNSCREFIDQSDDDVGTTNFRICRKLENGKTYYLKVRGFAYNTGRTWVKIEKACGGNNYKDSTKHTLVLNQDGCYVCSKCGYRIKSPELEDSEILSTDDYLKVISCEMFFSYLEIQIQSGAIEKGTRERQDILYQMITEIRQQSKYNNKYGYRDSSGKCIGPDIEYDSLYSIISIEDMNISKIGYYTGFNTAIDNLIIGYYCPVISLGQSIIDIITCEMNAMEFSALVLDEFGFTKLSLGMSIASEIFSALESGISLSDQIVMVRVKSAKADYIFTSNNEFKGAYFSVGGF